VARTKHGRWLVEAAPLTTLLPASAEVTVAHELIHLRDRVQGQPRRHRCHGNDAIALDEALITGRDPEALRVQLREETERREAALRAARPYRYLYSCPHCDKKYFRVGSAFYLDSQVRFHVKKQFEFYVGVNNLLNTQPPRVITGLPGSVTGTETAAGTYDPIGRRFYSGVRLKF